MQTWAPSLKPVNFQVCKGTVPRTGTSYFHGHRPQNRSSLIWAPSLQPAVVITGTGPRTGSILFQRGRGKPENRISNIVAIATRGTGARALTDDCLGPDLQPRYDTNREPAASLPFLIAMTRPWQPICCGHGEKC